MADSMTFGPQWLRTLSDGGSSGAGGATSVSSATATRYKPAQYRYGREEMLALFPPNSTLPPEVADCPAIAVEKAQHPMAFLSPTEEEQRLLGQSVNSSAVMRLAGRGGGTAPPPRGGLNGPPVRGGGRGMADRGRGRGRGRGDNYYGRPYEDDGFGRSRLVRNESWDDGRDKRYTSTRYDDESMPRRDYMRSVSTDNWRDTRRDEDDETGGWRKISTKDRWRGQNWREPRERAFDRDFSGEKGISRFDEPSHRPGTFDRPSSLRRSHSTGSWEGDTDGLPEWSTTDAEDIDNIGTFDSSGAFMSVKDQRPTEGGIRVTKCWRQQQQQEASCDGVKTKKITPPLEKDSNEETRQAGREETRDFSRSPVHQSKESSPTVSMKSDTSTECVNDSKDCRPVAHVDSLKAHVEVAGDSPTDSAPGEQKRNDAEEAALQHLEKTTENLVAWIADDDGTKCEQKKDAAPSSDDAKNWFYRDPQGDMQGPFAASEMAEWFSAGYFTMNLLVKRGCDDSFQPLGDLIKRWDRVPFLPGQPLPPIKNSLPSAVDRGIATSTAPSTVDSQERQQQLLAQQQQALLQQQQQQQQQQQFLQQQTILRQLQLQQMLQTLQQQSAFSKLTPVQQQQMMLQLLQTQLLQQTAQQPTAAAAMPTVAAQPQPASVTRTTTFSPRDITTSSADGFQLSCRENCDGGGDEEETSIWGTVPSPSIPPQTGVTTAGWTAPTVTNVWDIEPPKAPSLEMIQRLEIERAHLMVEKLATEQAAAERERLASAERQRRRDEELRKEQEEKVRVQKALEEKEKQRLQQMQLAQEELHRKREQEEAERFRREELEREEQRREEWRKAEQLQRQREEQRKAEELQRQREEQRKAEELQRHREEQRKMEELQRQREEHRKAEELQRQREEHRKGEELQRQREEQRKAEELQRQQEEQQKMEELRRREEERKEEERRQREEVERAEEVERKRQDEIRRRQEKADEIRRQQQLMATRRQQQEQLEALQLPTGAQWANNNNANQMAHNNNKTLSLSEIQQLESISQEKEKQKQMSEALHNQQFAAQQQAQANKSWSKRAPATSAHSLLDIQQEQAQQQKKKKSEIQQQTKNSGLALSTAAVWSSAPSTWGSEGAWANNKVGFWEEVPAASTNKKKTKSSASSNAQFPSLQNTTGSNNHTAGNGNRSTSKTKSAKLKKEEETVQKLFEASKPQDEFTKWCISSLSGIQTSVDVPTFVGFLTDVESPYEVHDYVKSYLGDSVDTAEFAQAFLARRSKFKSAMQQRSDDQESLWGPAPAVNPNVTRGSQQGAAQAMLETKSGKKKKKRMQKLDSSILGFTVHAAPDRINAGEIHYT